MQKTVHDFMWLASQSPRRQALLAQIGVTPQLLLPGDDEDAEALEVVQHGMIIPRWSVPMVVVWHAGSPKVVAYGVEACER